jgi:hypothetical protein
MTQIVALSHLCHSLPCPLLYLRIGVHCLMPSPAVDLFDRISSQVLHAVIPYREPYEGVLLDFMTNTDAFGGALNDASAERVFFAQEHSRSFELAHLGLEFLNLSPQSSYLDLEA